jgi:hypothetical protein
MDEVVGVLQSLGYRVIEAHECRSREAMEGGSLWRLEFSFLWMVPVLPSKHSPVP